MDLLHIRNHERLQGGLLAIMNQTITLSSDGLYIREKDTIQVIFGDQTQQVINVLDLVNGKFRYAKVLFSATKRQEADDAIILHEYLPVG